MTMAATSCCSGWVGIPFPEIPGHLEYNEEHQSSRGFVRDLIDYAHTRGVRVLLGFTPFGYNGVNHYPLEHPNSRQSARMATGRQVRHRLLGPQSVSLQAGVPAVHAGVRSGDVLRLLPERRWADDRVFRHAICHCPDCGERFFEKEFRFVRQISDEIWAKKPEAMIVVYPHYFSGAEVPGFGVQAAKLLFDSRWTLFFTPHSAHLDPELIRQARHSLWWDESPALRRPQDIQQGAIRARNAGVTGYVPSLEAYSFVPTEAEEGQEWLKGRRQVPLGFGWLKDGESPYDELPMRVNRIAYREFSDNPDLSFERFKEKLGQEVFGNAATSQLVDDLLELQRCSPWNGPGPAIAGGLPLGGRAMMVQGILTSDKRDEYQATLTKPRAIDKRHQEAKSQGERQLLQIVRWV